MSSDEGAGGCSHQPVYFGVVNINANERTIGSVDVWRCAACKRRFCEEKQLGIEELADLVGMPRIGADQRWAVSVCKLQQGRHKWRLVKFRKDDEISHECLDERVAKLRVSNFEIADDQHWSFLVDDHVNKAVEIG